MADMIVVQDTYLFLVETAMCRTTTSYSELLTHLNALHHKRYSDELYVEITPQVLEDALTSIAEHCRMRATSPLPILVVRSSGGSEGMVGKGFWDAYGIPYDQVSHDDVWLVQKVLTQSCYDHYEPVSVNNREMVEELETYHSKPEFHKALQKAFSGFGLQVGPQASRRMVELARNGCVLREPYDTDAVTLRLLKSIAE